jgi:hypothetical protein
MLILAYLNISKIIKSSFSGPHSTLIKETHAVNELALAFCLGGVIGASNLQGSPFHLLVH